LNHFYIKLYIFADIGDVRFHLVQGLRRLSPEHLSKLLGQIPESDAEHLKNYFQTAGITIA